MNKKYLLVDGYNIIFHWDNLTKLAETNLEDARIKLLETLCNYQGIIKYEIIVVFDAYKVKNGVEVVEEYKNIKIVFTKEAETADTYIERACGELVKNHNVTVATSDNLEQTIIMSKGAMRLSASDLKYDILESNKEINRFIEKKPIKNNMLVDNLDPKTAALLEEMRLNKNLNVE